MLALALQLALAPPQQPPSDFARAESLLASGRLTEARAATERLLRRSPDDPRLLTLLGRIHLDWPVFGRYAAESLFVRASRLDPANPEPFYWIGRTGLALGGDDGEMMSRPALLEVLRLQPDYRDAWELWLRLYRGDAERRDAVEALEAHAGSAGADLKRSQLLLELRDYPRALALLARALFESGADSAGARTYELALRLAHLDTDSVLWKQVRGIATPREREEYLRIGPGEREDFLRLFWARRDPHLASPLNERMGEHFRRMAEARRQFALLHPNARYHRSRLWRALAGGLGEPPGPELRGVIDAARATPCVAELPTAAVEVLSGTMSAGSLDSAGQTTVNL
ncbi:MAG TPA: GWxTD domain-containing protein, partial [Gemmatimonadales bacterium]|nr:GWxTD domain-containing protein [Gemmatimonadales bacterium]